jgi:hypothetical protein
MDRATISTKKAPAALGPFSQAIVAGGFAFCSGTFGIDTETGPVRDTIEALRYMDETRASAPYKFPASSLRTVSSATKNADVLVDLRLEVSSPPNRGWPGTGHIYDPTDDRRRPGC